MSSVTKSAIAREKAEVAERVKKRAEDARVRDEKIMKLLREGLRHRDICDRLGISGGHVSKMKKQLKETEHG